MSKDYPKPVEDGELREQLAAIEHERWADWQKWCHKVLRENNPSPEQGDILERWDRQIETPYAELSEKEKQSDIINRRESIMHHLLVGMTTEESIEMFNEISVLFVSAAEKRLKEVTEEKNNLEKFLNN